MQIQLIRFLLSLSPDIYDSKQSFTDAKKSIADIAKRTRCTFIE